MEQVTLVEVEGVGDFTVEEDSIIITTIPIITTMDMGQRTLLEACIIAMGMLLVFCTYCGPDIASENARLEKCFVPA